MSLANAKGWVILIVNLTSRQEGDKMKHTRLTVVGVSLVASIVFLLTSATLAYSSGELEPLLTIVFNCAASTPCLSSQNTGTYLAIQGISRRGFIGVYGYSDQTTGATYAGQYGAVRGYSNAPSGTGVYGYAKSIGVRGHQYDSSTTGYGGYFTGYRYGAWTQCLGSSCDAIRPATTASGAAWAVNAYSANSIGIYSYGNPSSWDGYFPHRIYAGGTIVSSTGMAISALNNGGEAVAPGDVVVFNGFVDSASGRILAVKKANGAADTAVVGVVQSALTLEEVAKQEVSLQTLATDVPEGEPPIESAELAAAAEARDVNFPAQTARFVEGAAGPGQNLTVLVQGIAKVRVDASNVAIRAGDTLVASGNTGYAASTAPSNAGSRQDENTDAREGEQESGDASARIPPGTAVGRALESLDGGIGEIYVLVGTR